MVYHFASSAFLDWPEYEKAIAGGWRTQGFHGPKHVFQVKATDPAGNTDPTPAKARFKVVR